MSNRAVPQGYLANLQFRIRSDNLPLLSTVQPSRGHKRGGRAVNYAEFDNELLEDFSNFPTFDIDSDSNDEEQSSASAGNDDPQANANGGEAAGVNGQGSGDGGSANTGAGRHGKSQLTAEMERNYKTGVPDLNEQKNSLNVLRYQKIRESFQHGKIAVPYRLYVPPELSTGQQEAILIPITLNVEHGNNTISDAFVWNVNDTSISVEDFVTTYCNDLGLYGNVSLHSQIVSSINEQIQELENVASLVIPDLEVVVNLTCTIQGKFFEDYFQWNLSDKSLSPEKFALIIVADLGLAREFAPGIAHSLHEYLLHVKKEWAEGSLHQDTVPNEAAFGYLAGVRLNIDDLGAKWTPKVEYLTQEEIQKREIEKERNMRRLKRESDRMGGGARRGRRRLDDLELTMKM